MSRSIRGSVRRSQIITTYGVGAIVAVEDESFMVTGIDRWLVDQPDLHEPRLERELHVQGFVQPPATGDDKGRDVPVVRFPTFVSCVSCGRLADHGVFAAHNENTCGADGGRLVPSRFVVVCPRGHIDDFPYFKWVHAGTRPTEEKRHRLTVSTTGATASLRDIVITCSCGKSSTMQGAFSKRALERIAKCSGRRPWLGDSEKCEETPRTLQRGASNVWFPFVRSALSIPPWSEGAFKAINRYWTALRVVPSDALAATIEGMKLTKGTSYSVGDLVAAVERRKATESTQFEATSGPDLLRIDEYEALVRGRVEEGREQDFICVPAAAEEGPPSEWFEQVMLVKKLREVRVLEAFTRLLPPGESDAPTRRAPIYREPTGWLPGIEVQGEGVFLQLREAVLREWEDGGDVRRRAAAIRKNYERRFANLGRAPDREISPRLILIHTLAHALIHEWALDSGYPAASLRERLFVGDSMAGLLIYTATTDSAGSMGGVVSRGEARQFDASLRAAILREAWCSADPLCIEAAAQGVDSLNLGACHACVLLPEVSCEESNVLLDRGLLVGSPHNIGFFSSLLR
jgi:hypothetical protein